MKDEYVLIIRDISDDIINIYYNPHKDKDIHLKENIIKSLDQLRSEFINNEMPKQYSKREIYDILSDINHSFYEIMNVTNWRYDNKSGFPHNKIPSNKVYAILENNYDFDKEKTLIQTWKSDLNFNEYFGDWYNHIIKLPDQIFNYFVDLKNDITPSQARIIFKLKDIIYKLELLVNESSSYKSIKTEEFLKLIDYYLMHLRELKSEIIYTILYKRIEWLFNNPNPHFAYYE